MERVGDLVLEHIGRLEALYSTYCETNVSVGQIPYYILSHTVLFREEDSYTPHCHIHTLTLTYIHTHTRTHARTHIHTRTRIHIHTLTLTHTRRHTLSLTPTHTHTLSHTHPSHTSLGRKIEAKLASDAVFSSFSESCKTEMGSNLDLLSYRLKPMQRLTK